MISNITKDNLNKQAYITSLNKLSEFGSITSSIIINIKRIIDQDNRTADKLYRITNLNENDSLKVMKDGKTFWGAIQKRDGTSKMATLQEVNGKSSVLLDPSLMMFSVSFAGIEADLEVLNRSINDLKFNLNDEKYLINNHKQVMDIRRTANKNLLFYKKEIAEDLTKNKLFTTSSSMNLIIEEIQKNLNIIDYRSIFTHFLLFLKYYF